MYRGRGGGYRGRGLPHNRGRGGYVPSRGRGNYHHHEHLRERDRERERGRHYDRPRSRSRSPRRYRSRSRSRSRDRYRNEYHRDRRSMSPSRMDRTDNEGLRITIQPRREDTYRDNGDRYYEERERDRHHGYRERERRQRSRSGERQRSRSGERRRSRERRSASSTRSASYSRSKLHSPQRGRSRSKDRSEPKTSTSDEILRITVGNDRYLQKPSAVERLGPPVNGRKQEQYVDTELRRIPSDQYIPEENDRQQSPSRPPPPQYHNPPLTRFPLDKPRLDSSKSSHHSRERSVPLSLHDDDLYSSRSDIQIDPYSSIKDTPRTEVAVIQPTLPLVPGLAQTLDIDDEDKFLYGDNEDSELNKGPGRHGVPMDAASLSKVPTPLSNEKQLGSINQFGDQDYRMRSDQHQSHHKKEDIFDRHDSKERFLDRALDIDRNPPTRTEVFSFKGESYPVTDYGHGAPVQEAKRVDTKPEPAKQSDDPTLQNILKSIGFDFELSKLMQERAQREREQQLKHQELEYTVKKSDSFIGKGLHGVDIKSVFDERSSYEDENVRRREAAEAEMKLLEEAKRASKRGLIASAETYEQRAKKYREEQARALEKEQTVRAQDKLHPLDYLTKGSRDDERTRVAAGSQKRNEYKSGEDYNRYEPATKHYREKLFEDDGDDIDQRPNYKDARDRKPMYDENLYERDTRDTRYGSRDRRQDDWQQKSKELGGGSEPHYNLKRKPTYYEIEAESSALGTHRSPRNQQAENDEKKLSENDLRNVLIASDKASKRTVLPPKTDRDRGTKQIPEDRPQKRIPPVLTAKQREQLEREKEERKQRLIILENELDKLRKQQGEMMRKKQRQKDGHKDPLLVENSKLQDEITKQISSLRKAVEIQPKEESKPQAAAVKFKMEKVPKVVKGQTALVESSSESEEERKSSKKEKTKTSSTKKSSKTSPPEEKSKSRKTSSQSSRSPGKKDGNRHDKAEKTEGKPKPKFHVNYEFFDAGNHWCRKCNVVCSNVLEVFQHLTKKQHSSKMDSYDRPWASDTSQTPKIKPKKGQSVSVPIPGVEFMMSTQAFFCRLCKVFSGDAICAEDHLKSEEHYKAYQAYANDNPFYEQRMKLDKAASISTATRGSDEKDKAGSDSQKRDDFKRADTSPALRVAQQKKAIEKQLRQKEAEEKLKEEKIEERKKLLENSRKQGKSSAEKVRLEFPPTGKIGKMTWAKQQQRIQEKIKQRQEETKEREAAHKNKLQFSLGKGGQPTLQTASEAASQAPRIDATTFIKKLQEEKEKIKVSESPSEGDNLGDFLTVGDSSLPIVSDKISSSDTETVKSPVKTINVAPTEKSETDIEREEDLKLLGIDPDSTAVIDISNKPPAMAARKPASDAVSPKSAASSSNLYNVLNPGASGANGVVVSSHDTRTTESDGCQKVDDDMDLGSEGSISMGDFEVLDEVA